MFDQFCRHQSGAVLDMCLFSISSTYYAMYTHVLQDVFVRKTYKEDGEGVNLMTELLPSRQQQLAAAARSGWNSASFFFSLRVRGKTSKK